MQVIYSKYAVLATWSMSEVEVIFFNYMDKSTFGHAMFSSMLSLIILDSRYTRKSSGVFGLNII